MHPEVIRAALSRVFQRDLFTKYEFVDFRSFSVGLDGPARYVHFSRTGDHLWWRPMIATRDVKIRLPAYGPDFVKATRWESRPRVQHW